MRLGRYQGILKACSWYDWSSSSFLEMWWLVGGVISGLIGEVRRRSKIVVKGVKGDEREEAGRVGRALQWAPQQPVFSFKGRNWFSSISRKPVDFSGGPGMISSGAALYLRDVPRGSLSSLKEDREERNENIPSIKDLLEKYQRFDRVWTESWVTLMGNSSHPSPPPPPSSPFNIAVWATNSH